MNSTRAYIRTGLGGDKVFKNNPFAIPVFQTVHEHDLKLHVEIEGGIELGIISKDKFFLSFQLAFTLNFVFDETKIIENFEKGPELKKILDAETLEAFRDFCSKNDFSEIKSKSDELEKELLYSIRKHGIESLKSIKFDVQRVPLDQYDLENIIQFEAAKEIVTRIARVQLKDKEFIEGSRKAIAHFDIVDE